MTWKDPSLNAFLSCTKIILSEAWGVLVSHFLDVKSGQSEKNLFPALAQIIMSGFTGVISGDANDKS
ncbi:MAG: hypothetical protein ACRDD5_14205 [Silvania sp.]|uniref:hypothetical protein n=1 Tax=Silvania sp. TaxID=3016633 RepID=UPI003EE71355